MTIKYDLKISNSFSGVIRYDKTDYLLSPENNKIRYAFYYTEGVLNDVYIVYDIIGKHGEYKTKTKLIDKSKFNQEFWKKAPHLLAFDDCKWERKDIIFSLNANSLSNNRTKVVV